MGTLRVGFLSAPCSSWPPRQVALVAVTVGIRPTGGLQGADRAVLAPRLPPLRRLGASSTRARTGCGRRADARAARPTARRPRQPGKREPLRRPGAARGHGLATLASRSRPRRAPARAPAGRDGQRSWARRREHGGESPLRSPSQKSPGGSRRRRRPRTADRSWRRHVAWVPQHPTPCTERSPTSHGDPAAGRAPTRAAALAGARVRAACPALRDRGRRRRPAALGRSGAGSRRAFPARAAPLVVLTGRPPTRTRRRVRDRAPRRGRTVLLIAPARARRADRVVVLSGGGAEPASPRGGVNGSPRARPRAGRARGSRSSSCSPPRPDPRRRPDGLRRCLISRAAEYPDPGVTVTIVSSVSSGLPLPSSGSPATTSRGTRPRADARTTGSSPAPTGLGSYHHRRPAPAGWWPTWTRPDVQLRGVVPPLAARGRTVGVVVAAVVRPRRRRAAAGLLVGRLAVPPSRSRSAAAPPAARPRPAATGRRRRRAA